MMPLSKILLQHLKLNPKPALQPLRKSTRRTRPPDWYGFSATSLAATLSTIIVPSGYTQPMKHECPQQTMQEELDALQMNQQTWDIVPCPSGVTPICCKYVLFC